MKLISLITLIMIFGLSLEAENQSFYDLKFKTLEGETVNMVDFKGKKVLIVNTASECGLTPQLEELQALHEEYSGKLVIIGFPSNDFANQEPLEGMEIARFCEDNFGVSFMLAEKVSVKGDEKHPVYQWLTSKEQNGKMDSEVAWNFQKYLISSEGELAEVIDPRTTPMSDKVTDLIE